MAGPSWDELDRAIRAKDGEAITRLWDLLREAGPGPVDAFLRAAEAMVERGGLRQVAQELLKSLANDLEGQALSDPARGRDLVRVRVRLARLLPEDAGLRAGLADAARLACAGRPEVEFFLEKSGVVGGATGELSKQAVDLERYLRLEPGAFVFHKKGWGIGRLDRILVDRLRCVIHFQSKPNHEMDILAAADLLERLPEDDLRVMKAYRADDLRRLVAEQPLEILRRTLRLFGDDAPLKFVKDALVPEVVAKTAWAAWWKEAKKQALKDPAWIVGEGSDPRLRYVEGGEAHFSVVIAQRLQFAHDGRTRRGVLRDLARTVGTDAEARSALAETARAELARCAGEDEVGRASWQALVADLSAQAGRPADAPGEAPESAAAARRAAVAEALAPLFAASPDPRRLLAGLFAQEPDEDVRELFCRGCLAGRPQDGPDLLLDLALAEETAAATVYADRALAAGDAPALDLLLGPALGDPVARPLLFEWAADRQVKGRWPGRPVDPYRLAEDVLRVLDATAYGLRRAHDAKRERAVAALVSLLEERRCAVVLDAAAATDMDGARHLLRLVQRNQGLKPRLLEKLENAILSRHHGALGTSAPAGAAAPGAPQPVYMTKAGLERLRRELERLEHEEMPANRAEIQRAREFGDLSENAEYHAAREKQGMLDAREKALKNLIALAREIRPEIVRTDAVSVGTRVRLRDAQGAETTYSLLGPSDVDVARNIINYQTPLAQSLMNRRPGETVTLEVMGHTHTWTVLEVSCAV